MSNNTVHEAQQSAMRIDFTRDSRRRCMHCGAFSPGVPLCGECTDDVMEKVEARRWRMQLWFYSITFFGILSYYLVL